MIHLFDSYTLRLGHRLVIPPKSTVTYLANCSKTTKQTNTFHFSPSDVIPDGIVIEESLGKLSELGKYQLLIHNISNVPLTLDREFQLGTIETMHHLIGKIADENTAPAINLQTKKQPVDLTAINVEPEFRQVVETLILKFNHLFANNNSDLGQTSIIKHLIETEGATPIRLRPYRTARQNRNEMDRQIQECFRLK